MKTKKLTHSKMLKILKEARHTPDIDFIKLNIDDFYDLVEEGKLEGRLDCITQRRLQKNGIYGHLDGFDIYCSLDLGNNRYCLGKPIIDNKISVDEHGNLHPKTEGQIDWSEPQNI